MSDDHDDDDPSYKVGYGKPPKASQFKPGKSGNPKGRVKQGNTVNSKVHAALHRTRKLSDGRKTTAVDLIIERGVSEIAAGRPGKWPETFEFLSLFDPKQKFTPTSDDEARLSRLMAES